MGFKFMSNEYRLYPIQFTEDFQQILNKNVFDMLTLFKNFTKPPFTKVSEVKPKVSFPICSYFPKPRTLLILDYLPHDGLDAKYKKLSSINSHWKVQNRNNIY